MVSGVVIPDRESFRSLATRYTESDPVECARIGTADLAKLIDWP